MSTVKLNSPQVAVKLLDDALAAGQQIQEELTKALALSPIAESYAKLDRWHQAQQAIESCPSNSCRVELLAAALTVWAEEQHEG
jgi:ferredoxin